MQHGASLIHRCGYGEYIEDVGTRIINKSFLLEIYMIYAYVLYWEDLNVILLYYNIIQYIGNK